MDQKERGGRLGVGRRKIPRGKMPDDEAARRLESKKGETWSWTQLVSKGKMSDEEDRQLETRNWTQKEPDRKMSNNEVYCLERDEKETRAQKKPGRREGKER